MLATSRVDDLSERITATRRHASKAAMSVAACLMPLGLAAASNLEVRVRDCRSNVDVEAHNVRLSDVLARLAKALDFKMRIEGADPLVNVSMSAPAPQVVAALAAEHGSFMIQHASDPRCPGMSRVSMLWLTPKATASAPAAKAGTATTRAAAIPVTETATPERLRQVEQDAARRKEAYEIYVRLNGKPPPGEPEEAATP